MLIFFSTGGAGLYRTVRYYLIPGLPDKTHTWSDFVYNGDKKVSGFYAWGDEESIKIWTLSGLKRFYTKPGFSIYHFLDTCEAVRQLKEVGLTSAPNDEVTYFTLEPWQKELKPEYFVTIWPQGKEGGHVMINKALARSGKYKVLGKIERGVCEQ